MALQYRFSPPLAVCSSPRCACQSRKTCRSGRNSDDSSEDALTLSRRELAMGFGAALALTEATPKVAEAGPFPGGLLGGSDAKYSDPVKVPRNKLDQRFAVLLVRSVYEAVDTLDFIPMSEFQAKFWKLRQNEYEPYLKQYSPIQVRQGDLQDPLYFDFISFAQMATIDKEILNGRQVFEEYCEECSGQKRVVTRSPELKNNALLPIALQQTAGDSIFRGLRDGFREEAFRGPAAREPGAHISQLARDVQQILDIFVDKGYALKASVANVVGPCTEGSCEHHGAHASEGTFQIKLDGPANLWSFAALSRKGSKLNTSFSAMTIDAYLRASGVQAKYSLSSTPSSIVQKWSLA